MSGVIFYFFVAGPKRVEFLIGINDHGSQCNMLYWMYYLTVVGKDLLRNGRNIGLHVAVFPIGEDPKSTLFGRWYDLLHHIFTNFTVTGVKHVFRITRILF
jgi:hypothetical protein